MSEENEKQVLVDEIRQRIQLLVADTGLPEAKKVEVLREVMGIIEDSSKEQAVK